jgi:hypothetical protein
MKYIKLTIKNIIFKRLPLLRIINKESRHNDYKNIRQKSVMDFILGCVTFIAETKSLLL